jgi:predicted HTH transcriptional regulator
MFFLRSLAEQVRRLNTKIERERLVLAPLPELSVQIVELAREQGRVTMGDVIRLTGASRNTPKHHLRALVAQGHITRHSGGRGSGYE